MRRKLNLKNLWSLGEIIKIGEINFVRFWFLILPGLINPNLEIFVNRFQASLIHPSFWATRHVRQIYDELSQILSNFYILIVDVPQSLRDVMKSWLWKMCQKTCVKCQNALTSPHAFVKILVITYQYSGRVKKQGSKNLTRARQIVSATINNRLCRQVAEG